MRTRLQTFEYREIPRSSIQNAPYNPRTINDDARARLRANLEKVGLLTTLVWNARSGHLVGGHQRLAILDLLEGSEDYTLGVAVVDLDETAERELNVFLNNTWAQGEFDVDALMTLLDGSSVDLIEAMGWTAPELLLEYGAREELAFVMPETPRSAKGRKTAQDTLGPHVMLVFSSNLDKGQFLRHLGRPETLMRIGAEEIREYVRPEHDWRVEADTSGEESDAEAA